jgi:hypothetical protein
MASRLTLKLIDLCGSMLAPLAAGLAEASSMRTHRPREAQMGPQYPV